MVRVGHFTVNLVRADTKEVFKEHTGPDNNTYAEVEPGVDYFVRVETSRGELVVKTKVDGIQVHKMSGKASISCKYIGNWERTNGENKTTALRFNSAAQATRQEDGENNPSMLTGKVEVKFYERGAQTRVKKNHDVAPKQFKSDVKVAGKKCVLSGNGSQHVIKGSTETRRFGHQKGKRLCTITLYYCTTMGLILNKILDAPPSSQPAPLVPAPLIDNDTKGTSAKPEKKVKPEKKRSASAAMLPPPEENDNKKVAAAIDLTGDDDENVCG